MFFRLATFLLAMSLAQGVSAAPLRFDTPQRWLTLAPNDPAQFYTVLFGRVNADKMADVVIYDYRGGRAFVALSNGKAFGALQPYGAGLPTTTVGTSVVLLADVNGDGLDDLIILNHGDDSTPGAATAVVALNTGKAFANPTVWNASWCANYQTCLAADVNGDHKADLVAFTPAYGTVWGSLSQGATFGADAIFNSYFCITEENCKLGDVDGDGKADIVLFKPHAAGVQKGNVLWAHSTGTAFQDVKLGHGYFCIDSEVCLVGDVNGDGKADIVLVKGVEPAGPNAQVLVSLSNGTTFVNATPFIWATLPNFAPGFDYGSFALADVNGDGRADLIEWGSQYRMTAPGTQTLSGIAFNVSLVTDAPPPSPPGSSPPPQGGGQPPYTGPVYRTVNLYNCEPDYDDLTYFITDETTHSGPIQLDGQSEYPDDGGYCPDTADFPPVSYTLTSGHTYLIQGVDPEALGCDDASPSTLACQYGAITLRGGAAGVCNWILSAETPSCNAAAAPGERRVLPPRTALADACAPGFVWRLSRTTDHVCVTPEAQIKVRAENLRFASRRSLNAGRPGPDTCPRGLVWRQAVPRDHVCVEAAVRDRVRQENRRGPERRAKP